LSDIRNLMSTSRPHALWILLLGVGLLRLVSLAVYPLMDPTEARYGEIARIMLETGNWIVPQIDYGVPFWGKPPLSFWAGAVSIGVFKNSEFFLRLPHVLAAAAVLSMAWQFARALGFSRQQALGTISIIATSIGFLIAAGAVMTDMFLTLAMTMTMTGFWRGWHGEKAQVYIMYAGLGIGLLAKGPVIIALAGLALFPWLVVSHGIFGLWQPLWQRMKLPGGLLLMLLIAAPWYWLAERANPGFLEYFLVGEHFQRFVDSGWRGDLYGSGHERTRGIIWIYWMLAALPWSPILVFSAARTLFRQRLSIRPDPLTLFALLWMCSPMLLFTLAGNVLPAYVLPGLPAIGLLTIAAMRPRRHGYLFLVGPALLLFSSGYAALIAGNQFSDKEMLVSGIDSGDALYYLGERPYSAQYYSDGRAIQAQAFPDERRFYLVTRRNFKDARLDQHCELRSQNVERALYFCRLDPPA
jgi:4-amino-4-deoxy-L-arabinose transferase-like glycosyltransferase